LTETAGYADSIPGRNPHLPQHLTAVIVMLMAVGFELIAVILRVTRVAVAMSRDLCCQFCRTPARSDATAGLKEDSALHVV